MTAMLFLRYNHCMDQKRESARRRVFDIIQIGNRTDFASRNFDIFIVITILVNITVLFLQTFDSMEPYMDLLKTLETITILIFCVEYGLRIWTARYLFPGESSWVSIRKFLLSYDGIIDLLTILPFFFLDGFIAFRMLRVVRIFHLFRINANYDSFNVIKSVIYDKRNQLASSVFIIFILILASSLGMYSVEHDAQPEYFRNAFSGIWWSVSALLTVGYGDIYPVTAMGRILAIFISFLGVGAVAIPTGIISAGFVEQYSKAANSSVSLEMGTSSVVIDLDSSWIGLSADRIHEEYHCIIILIQRGDAVFIPSDDYRVAFKDQLIVYQEKEN